MKGKKFAAVIMSLFMVLSLLPVTVFAAETTAIDGKLKIKGEAAVGEILSAEFKEVKPEGLSEDSVSYVWYRKAVADTEETNLKELGKEKTYTLTQEDLGSVVVLTVAGLAEKGFSGSLKAETKTIAEALPKDQETQETNPSEEENPQQPAEPEQEITEEIPQETESQTAEPETGEAGSESVEGIPAAQEDGTVSENPEQEAADVNALYDLEENEILTPIDPSEGGEAGSEEVEGIPPAEEDEPSSEETDGTEGGTSEDVQAAAEAVNEEGESVIDFGILTLSQAAEQPIGTLMVKNTGTQPLNFIDIDASSSPNFAVNDIGHLEPGSSVPLDVWPRESIAPGTYEDQIEYRTEEGATAAFTIRMVVTEDEPSETPEITETPEQNSALSADREAMSFETAEGQTLTISNMSEEEITLLVSADSGYVTSDPDMAAIPAKETAEFQIYPSDTAVKGQENLDTLTFTDAVNPVNTLSIPVTVNIPEEPEKHSDVTADRSELDFGTVIEGYTEAPQAQTIVLVNNGTGDAQLSAPVSENGEAKYFDVQFDSMSLPAGASTEVTISPKTGLTAEAYSESFTITDEATGNNIVLTARITVNSVSHNLTASPAALEFAAVKEGYGQIETQQITITNNGNVTENLTQPAGGKFEISQTDEAALTLEPGASVSFTVRPKKGLKTGNYEETIQFASQAAETGVKVTFQVIKGTATVNRIENPGDITGIANGTKKDAESLGLPSTVVIGTTNGTMNASVAWDVNNCSYDPSSTEEQTFTVKGAVTLPEGVDNENNLTLAATVRVTVKAYAPRTVSAENNKVTGIEYNGVYTTQSKISFQAVGAGMENTSPRKGDTRYLPLTWSVINTYNLKADSYGASFGLAQSGDYTLKVTFQLQTFDGSEWVKSENYDTRKVPFTISKAKVTAPGQNLTPAANRKNAVRTGDDSVILPFVILLVIAAAAVGVIIYRKRK